MFKRLSVVAVVLVLSLSMGTAAFAEGLNDIGAPKQPAQTVVGQGIKESEDVKASVDIKESEGNKGTESGAKAALADAFSEDNISDENRDSAAAVGEIFRQGGLDEESVAKAAKWVEPVAKVINAVTAVLLALLALALGLMSLIDVLYLTVPAVRPFLAPEAPTAGPMGMTTPMAGAGFGGPTGAMGMMGSMGAMGSQSSAGFDRRWVSDDAVAALAEAQPSAPQMGMGMGMGMQTQARSGGKHALAAYAKKRAFTLVMLGVCVVLFTCTIFTDLGVMLGMKVLSLLSGLGV